MQGDRGSADLLERERELVEIEQLVRDACSGSGRVLVVEGSAGLGKTRLIEAARGAAAADMRVLAARGTELERSSPYALVRQLLEPALSAMRAPERERAFSGAAAAAGSALRPSPTRLEDRFGVLHGLYWLTVALAEREPLLLAVDDLHLADSSSLDYLCFLLPRLDELPVLLAVACRPKEPGADPGLLQVVSDPSARHVSPLPLSRRAARALLHGRLGEEPAEAFAAACHEVSGGNPFLLSELVMALSARSVRPSAAQASLVREITPDRVARDVLVRLGRLSSQARAVAHALVVLGDGSAHELVAALGGLDARTTLNAADELRAAAILDASDSLRFVHPLIRTTLYSDLPAGERAAGHLAAAALLRSRGAAPERLAAHLLAGEARGSRETVQTLMDAAMRALASGAPQPAVAYLLRALREPAPADLRATVLRALLMAAMRAADDSVRETVEAEIAAEVDRNPQLLCRWARLLAVWLALSGRIGEAIPLLERAIEAALRERAYDRAFRLEAQVSSFARLPPAEIRVRLGRYRDGIQPDSPEERLTATFDAAWCLVHGDALQGVAVARRALEEGRIFAEQPELLAPGWAMMTLWAAGALEDARLAAEQAFSIASERGSAPEIAAAWLLRGGTEAAAGNLAAAEADHRQAVHIARLGGIRAALPLYAGSLSAVLIDRGALDEAASALAQVSAADDPVVWFMGPSFFRGRLQLAQGELRQAAEQMLAVQRRLEGWGLDGIPFMQPRMFAACALAGLGELARARALAEEELDHARRWGAAVPLARVRRALARAVGGAEGLELLREAVASLEESPAKLERARALAELGAALRRAKRSAAARAPLREALDLARRCGAGGLAKYVHDELNATGERLRRYVPIGVESLTASERRIAEMAAGGMTNREIAQALFLTVKTIEGHLSSVYAKLGIRSRRLLSDALTDDRRSDGVPASPGETALRSS